MDRIEWGLKESFREYVSMLPDLEVALDGVTFDRDSGRYAFPLPGDDLRATGELHLAAHGGLLDVRITAPAIVRNADGWELMDAGEAALARLLDGPVDPEEIRRSGWVFQNVALTIDGSGLFGAVYSPWTRMDSVHVIVEPKG